MNGADLLRIVDLMHREKNIPKDVIFDGIEAALQLATEKHYGEEAGRHRHHRPRLRRDHALKRARRSSSPSCWAASPPRAPSR